MNRNLYFLVVYCQVASNPAAVPILFTWSCPGGDPCHVYRRQLSQGGNRPGVHYVAQVVFANEQRCFGYGLMGTAPWSIAVA
jgi:hypothetical protein